MKDIDFRSFFTMMDKGHTQKSVFHVGDGNIHDFQELEKQFDKRGITKMPKDVEEFYEIMGYEEIEICHLNEIDNWPEKQYELVVNAGSSSRLFDQIKFFDQLDRRTLGNGYQLHVVPFLSTLDNEFYSYNPRFFSYMAESLNMKVLYGWFMNYILTRFLETTIYDNFVGYRYEKELGISWFQNENWTSHIALAALLQKQVENVQEDD